ncbi:MAG TPA: NAD(P)-dependent oxidoreductase [Oligoflexia bacterium]|nr:NAD(P)-dependent oxidoreductase [Oligoflexia bacterium]HMP47708.1 NAD(P)-dependent oxidoreductase [Oligoflexia bacterium]
MSDNKKILVTGSAGFIGGYVVEELLNNGWTVVGIDNFSKYGEIEKSYDSHPNYHFVRGDVKNTPLMMELAEGCSHILAGAAMIGGISYFHEFAYDLLSENERIMASTFDSAIHGWKKGTLKKITVLSSSMVFESTNKFPSPEGEELACPPPKSTYGFQKLACEYFARGAFEQYQLPYTIVRPFNCVGVGEKRALSDHEIMSGNVKLAMSHVVPDLIQKLVKGQDPLHILGDGSQIRHYTYGGDLARGIRIAIEHEKALNEDFNISTETGTTVRELAEVIWKKIKGDNVPLRMVSDDPFVHDVQKRVPDCSKAKKLLGYEATTSLEQILDEVIPWVTEQVKLGAI